jgi:hypothetical protein
MKKPRPLGLATLRRPTRVGSPWSGWGTLKEPVGEKVVPVVVRGVRNRHGG